jgi:hypothetical protein
MSFKGLGWAKVISPGINFINMLMRGFFMRKTKKLLVIKNEFHHTFCTKILLVCHFQGALSCPGCHSQVPISYAQKASKKPGLKMLMKSNPEGKVTNSTGATQPKKVKK